MVPRQVVYCGLLLAAVAVCSAARATPCTPTDCKLPNCHCASTSNPGRFPEYDTPQIVNIVVDEGIRKEDYPYYQSLFDKWKNPNLCPYQGTFIATHNYTDYAVVENLYASGHEIGDSTVTQQPPASYWEKLSVEGWMREMSDQRLILNHWAGVPEEEIRGFRAPYLITDDNELQALYNLRFLYDATMHSVQAYWPFTFDYQTPLCSPPDTCPTNSYPGLWECPAIEMFKANGQQCETLPECRNNTESSTQEWFSLIWTNFQRHYSGNRAPFGLYFDPQLFYIDSGNAYRALSDFLTELQGEAYKDVYVVTLYQTLQWVRNPRPLSEIHTFEPWQCPQLPPPRCSPGTETRCGPYKVGTEMREFYTCVKTCPRNYPNIGNPYGY